MNPAAPCAWQVVMITWRELFAWRRNGGLSTKWHLRGCGLTGSGEVGQSQG